MTNQRRIEDFAIIGNCRSAALIHRDGTLEWLCLPHFDSDACFASLLGTPDNGHWTIRPRGKFTSTRRYVKNTLLLETTFSCEDGEVQLLDWLSVETPGEHLFRTLRCLEGTVELEWVLCPRFEYGSRLPWVTAKGEQQATIICGPDQLALFSSHALKTGENDVRGLITLEQDDEARFQLSWTRSHEEAATEMDAEMSREENVRFWRKWLEQSHLDDEALYPEIVHRSLLTLKALTFEPTGSIIAAVTTSLPEAIGAERNWDYRFSWPRDAAFAIRTVMKASTTVKEVEAWRDWLLRATSGVPSQMEVLYTLDGRRPRNEATLPWLKGFSDSSPVRIGNRAHDQRQHDIYGSVIEVFYYSQHEGLQPLEESWKLARKTLSYLEGVWQKPDEGIWEVRGPKRQFVHGKLMVWAAFNWCIKAVEEFGIDGDCERWRDIREQIHREICHRGFNPEVDSFTQYYGARETDASLLLLPLLEFLPIDDPRIRGTVEKIERDLLLEEGLLLRYLPNPEVEGLPDNGKRAFLLCSGWLGQVYAQQGEIEKAIRVYEKLRSIANDVGLLSEQYDPKAKQLLGNFPQALSHIALLSLEQAILECSRDVDPERLR